MKFEYDSWEDGIVEPVPPPIDYKGLREQLNLDVPMMLGAQNGGCAYCNVPMDQPGFPRSTIEHRTPRWRGGTNDKDNLCLTCWNCNNKKGSMTEEEYLFLRDYPIALLGTKVLLMDIRNYQQLLYRENRRLPKVLGIDLLGIGIEWLEDYYRKYSRDKIAKNLHKMGVLGPVSPDRAEMFKRQLEVRGKTPVESAVQIYLKYNPGRNEEAIDFAKTNVGKHPVVVQELAMQAGEYVIRESDR